jgi:hypothetical protein
MSLRRAVFPTRCGPPAKDFPALTCGRDDGQGSHQDHQSPERDQWVKQPECETTQQSYFPMAHDFTTDR